MRSIWLISQSCERITSAESAETSVFVYVLCSQVCREEGNKREDKNKLSVFVFMKDCFFFFIAFGFMTVSEWACTIPIQKKNMCIWSDE